MWLRMHLPRVTATRAAPPAYSWAEPSREHPVLHALPFPRKQSGAYTIVSVRW